MKKNSEDNAPFAKPPFFRSKSNPARLIIVENKLPYVPMYLTTVKTGKNSN